MPVKSKFRADQNGFTIVELMIALSILSIVLLISTVTLLALGKLFTKGNTLAATQNAARNISNEIVSQIEFGASAPRFVYLDSPTDSKGSLCIGNQRYTFLLNTHSDSTGNPHTSPHVLWRDTMSSDSVCSSFDMSIPTHPTSDLNTAAGTQGAELIPKGMRISQLSVVPSATDGVYTIVVTVAADDGGTPSLLDGNGTHCVGILGDQNCAVSTLTETVVRRLTN